MRYQAPLHTSAVYAPSRPYNADENGVIEVPDDAPDGDHAALRSVGCVPVADASAPAKAKPVKAEPEVEAPLATEQPEGENKD